MDFIADILGDWSKGLNIYSILFRVIISVVLSALIGCERTEKRHSAGLRTFISISLSMTTVMMLELFLAESLKISYFFLSSAAIIGTAIITVRSLMTSSRNQIKGFTTSAGLWGCGIIGLTVGAGFYTMTVIGFAVLIICLAVLPPLEIYLKNRSKYFEVHLELKSSEYLQNFVGTIRRLGLKIDDIEKNNAYAGSGLSVYSIAISISSEELKKYKTHTEIIEALRTLDYVYHIEEMNM